MIGEEDLLLKGMKDISKEMITHIAKEVSNQTERGLLFADGANTTSYL